MRASAIVTLWPYRRQSTTGTSSFRRVKFGRSWGSVGWTSLVTNTSLMAIFYSEELSGRCPQHYFRIGFLLLCLISTSHGRKLLRENNLFSTSGHRALALPS